ncbi:recombinase family protein [Corynebacterium camporealensis]|uniref:recombinase family protein n=1 Tax=Corynebacterium camporealensis TaxID=161896 RepID=UPI0034CDCEC5
MGYAIYCRISRDIAGEGAGVDRQEKECRNLAQRDNLTIDKVYRDNDISAFGGKTRPAYEEMLKAIKDGKHDGIICWHVDRLYRRTRDLEAIVDLVEETKIRIRTVNAGDLDLDTATGRVTARLVAAIANYEVDHMIERSKSSQQSRAAQGKYRGGYVAYGYRAGAEKGTIEIDPEQAAVVREAATAILNGTPVLALAKRFNDRGILTQKGRKWRTSTVRRMLTKPTIAGLSHYYGEIVGPGEWPAIIDEEDWRAVCAILSDPSRRTHKGNLKRWQGAGLYMCGRCGSVMRTKKTHRSSSKSGRAYQCPECSLTRDLDWTDELVSGVILEYLNMPENRIKILETEDTDTANVAGLLKQREGLVQRKNELGSLFARGDIDAAQLTTGNAELARMLDSLDRKLAQARTESPLTELVLDSGDLESRWLKMTAEQRSEIIDALMTVTIMPAKPGPGFDPNTINIEWK